MADQIYPLFYNNPFFLVIQIIYYRRFGGEEVLKLRGGEHYPTTSK